jgi:hypothetical protein
MCTRTSFVGYGACERKDARYEEERLRDCAPRLEREHSSGDAEEGNE